MVNDRELLEMAAKAAGIVLGEHARFIGGDHPQLWFYNDSRKHPMCRKPNRPGNVPWAPLADDGDALRLAVKLNLWEAIRLAHRGVSDTVDIYAATRRAIVRAAAAIGETQ